MSTFTLRVFGIPLPQARPRAFKMKGTGAIRMYDPDTSRDWKRTVSHEAALCRPRDLFAGPLDLELVFFLPRPKSAPARVTHHTTKPDADNLAKSIKDALRGIVYHDDSQIVALRVWKRFAGGVDPPGVSITIETMNGEGAGDRRRAG